MPPLTLYEREGCWKCVEVHEVLERLGLEYAAVDVRAVPEAGRRMKAATDQRYVPALQDGRTWVWDRRRVIRYLEETYGDGAPGAEALPDWMGGVRVEPAGGWLPPGWSPPPRADLPTGHHLRPIRADDVDLDMPAVMGSRERLWAIFGEAWGWPPAGMTREQDRADLARHEDEAARGASFNYALFDAAETELLGCVYIDPPERAGADAEISWWVRDECVGTPVEAALDAFVPAWIAGSWPFTCPRLVGRDISWREWLALPGA